MPAKPKRRHDQPRCRDCGLAAARCLCAGLPRFVTNFEWLLVQHAVEIDRPTNTGRMAARMLSPVRILPYGLRGAPFEDAPLCDPAADYLLLSPRPGARVLRPDDLAAAAGRRTVVVLLDGSWAQASHMARRIGVLRTFPAFVLPPGPPGRWRIRRPPDPSRLCTLEAAIRVVALSGREREAEALAAAMDRIQAEMWAMKGKTPSHSQDALNP